MKGTVLPLLPHRTAPIFFGFFCAILMTLSLFGQTELVKDTFEDGTVGGWSLGDGANSGADLSVVDIDGGKALCVSTQTMVLSENKSAWIFQPFGMIDSEKSYTLSFEFKLETEEGEPQVIAAIADAHNLSHPLFRAELDSPTTWKRFSFTVKGSETSGNCLLAFVHFQRAVGKYYFRSVVLQQID